MNLGCYYMYSIYLNDIFTIKITLYDSCFYGYIMLIYEGIAVYQILASARHKIHVLKLVHNYNFSFLGSITQKKRIFQ